MYDEDRVRNSCCVAVVLHR